MNQLSLAIVKEKLVEQIADNFFCGEFNGREGRGQVQSNLITQAVGIMNFGRDQFGFDTQELHALAMEIYNERKELLETETV